MAKRKRRMGQSASRRGKALKTSSKRPAKRPVSKKAKRSAKKAGTRLVRKARPATAKARPRKRKRVPAPAPQVETEIVDLIEEPLPGVVTVTEIQSTRVILPDSDEEKGEGNG